MSGYYRLPHGWVAALEGDEPFPPVEEALQEPNGLLAIGGELTPQRLLEAYRQGIFPWYSAGEPVLWWSPDPRLVLLPEAVRISRSLAKTLRQHDYEVRYDSAFGAVIEACATTPRPGPPGSWIVPEMAAAYCRLHALGYAHSVETWIGGKLAGGLYGVAIGRMFYGESMFQRQTDASKIALVHLAWHLQQQGVGMIDCQMTTSHLQRFGAEELTRREFSRRLTELVNYPYLPGHWRHAHDPAQ